MRCQRCGESRELRTLTDGLRKAVVAGYRKLHGDGSAQFFDEAVKKAHERVTADLKDRGDL